MLHRMWKQTFYTTLTVAVCLSALLGCARAHRDTSGYGVEESITVDASFETAWQAVKGVLRDQNLEVYTRDKRGQFVAFTTMKRRFYQPNRTKFSIFLDSVHEDETQIRIEVVRQRYGVTPLTYPGWHDRPARGNSGAQAILDAVTTRLSAPVEGASGV
jgi:hypothetical protein